MISLLEAMALNLALAHNHACLESAYWAIP